MSTKSNDTPNVRIKAQKAQRIQELEISTGLPKSDVVDLLLAIGLATLDKRPDQIVAAVDTFAARERLQSCFMREEPLEDALPFDVGMKPATVLKARSRKPKAVEV